MCIFYGQNSFGKRKFEPLGAEQTVTFLLVPMGTTQKAQFVQSPWQKSLQAQQSRHSLFRARASDPCPVQKHAVTSLKRRDKRASAGTRAQEHSLFDSGAWKHNSRDVTMPYMVRYIVFRSFVERNYAIQKDPWFKSRCPQIFLHYKCCMLWLQCIICTHCTWSYMLARSEHAKRDDLFIFFRPFGRDDLHVIPRHDQPNLRHISSIHRDHDVRINHTYRSQSFT